MLKYFLYLVMVLSYGATKNIGGTPGNRSDKPRDKLTAYRCDLITLTW